MDTLTSTCGAVFGGKDKEELASLYPGREIFPACYSNYYGRILRLDVPATDDQELLAIGAGEYDYEGYAVYPKGDSVKEIRISTAQELSVAFYNAWMDTETPIKLLIPANLRGTLEELEEESEEKEMETSHIDWEIM